MRKGWEYKKLGEVATYINGYAFKPDQWKESGTPIVRIQNLNNANAPYNYYDGEVPNKVKIQNGDLLISWSASLGAYIWNGGKAFLNQHIFKVAFDKTDIDKFFLKYAVTSKLAAMAEQVHGATMKHIVKKDFENTSIPYPPLSTQLSIVSELDKINELIRLKKEQLKDFDNLAQSIFYEMFGDPVENERGWEVKKLGEIYKMKSGESLSTKNFVEGDVPVYGGNGISGYHNQYNKDGSYIIIGRVGVYCGNARIVKGQFWLTDNAFELFYDKSIQNEVFVCKLLNLLNLRQYANAAAQPVISNNTLKHIPVPLPPLPLQHLFAQRIEQIEHQKAEVQKSITDLETLLASRMQYWFE